MSTPATADQFLELGCKSGLLEPQSLQAYLQRRRAATTSPEAPRALGEALVRDGLLTRFQVEQLLLGRWRNFILSGKYKVLGPLGSGGMGQVFLCEHLVMRRRVAVKVLPAARSDDPVALERFHREARAVARLHHPNIVGAHDVDRDGKLHFLVMEYVDGKTFHQIIRGRGPMAPLRAAHYIRQAALGLQHAHEADLVHRDIKPSNLLLDRQGTVKVLDMGLARFFHDESDDLSRRHVESPLGTTDYMAPEQALNSHTADIRADIYSLGVTFYHLLTGQVPFPGGSALEKLLRHQTQKPPPVRSLRPEVPAGLAAVVERLLAKRPEDRYQTPAEVAEALAPWTQTPIPPPAAEEMPELLAASRGTSCPKAASGDPAVLYGPALPNGPAKAESGVHSTGSRPRSDPFLVVARGPGASAAPTAGIVWEGLTATRPTLSGVGETAGPGPQPEGVSNGPRHPPRAVVLGWPWAVAAAAAVLLAGAGGFAIYRTSAPKLPPPGRPGEPSSAAEDSPRLRLLVPAYFYPAKEGLEQWDRLLGSPAAGATVVVANPNSGPGATADPNYVRVLERARQKGVTVIGYVSTKYAARPLHEVKGDVDRWLRFYPGVQGIFFDEQASAADQVPYYAALYEYVRTGSGLALVITNPGTACAEEYLARPAADVVCLAETTRGFEAYRPPAWAGRYPARCFAALVCRTGNSEQMRQYVRGMPDRKVGYGYITDGRAPNPWGQLPHYWGQEADAVRQVNAR